MKSQRFYSFNDLITQNVHIHFEANEIRKSVSVVTLVMVVCKRVISILNLIYLNIFQTTVLDFHRSRKIKTNI
jgi:hypothetical protein